SPYVTGRAAAALEKLYGGTVRVGSADIGLHGTVLKRVELFEKGDGPGQQPWMSIDRLETDLSLWDILHGGQPTKVVVRGVTVHLRFDDNGPLLTQLPTPPNSAEPLPPLPEVQVTDSRVLLVGTKDRQLLFEQVEATLKPDGTRYDLAGGGRND